MAGHPATLDSPLNNRSFSYNISTITLLAGHGRDWTLKGTSPRDERPAQRSIQLVSAAAAVSMRSESELRVTPEVRGRKAPHISSP